MLLALGATRFDLFGEEISDTTDFVSKIPARYRRRDNGILLYLAVSKHIGFPDGVSKLPWEYMLYEGHAGESVRGTIDRLKNVPWLGNAQICSERWFADGDTPERPVILLRRAIPHTVRGSD